MTRLLIVLVCAALLAGCGKHYWSKPGGTEAGFAQDHRACTQEVGLATVAKDYLLVPKKFYVACLQARGWTRAQQVQPAADAFRGIEGDEIVRVDSPPPPR